MKKNLKDIKKQKRSDETQNLEIDILMIAIILFTGLQIYFNLGNYLVGLPRFFEIWKTILIFLKYLLFG